MHDGRRICVDPPPARFTIKQSDHRIIRRENGPRDVIICQYTFKHDWIRANDGRVSSEEGIPVEIGPAVDEWTDAAEDQVATEAVVIEYRLFPDIFGDMRHGGDRIEPG